MSSEHFSFGCDGEREGLPDDARILYDQLLADGAAWRAEQPAPSRLDDEIATLVSARVASRRQRATDTRSNAQIPDLVNTSRYPKGASHMHSSRIRGFIAGGAMAAVVALIAFLLLSAAPGRYSPSPASSASPISIPAGKWVPQPKLDDTADLGGTGDPAVAPTNTRVVYEATNSNTIRGEWNVSLRRTDDGGSTWHALSLPVPTADVNYVNMFVSPIDAHTVWLQLSDQAANACPADESGMGDVSGNMHGGILASGSGFCGMEWYSSDAGQHWTAVKLPVPGLLSGTGLNTPAIAGQGSRLFASSGCVSRICTRLLTSTDGGATWQAVDGGVLTSSSTLCDFAPAPASSTIFAVTSDSGDCTWLDAGTRRLWRSDDAGAHWTQVSLLPFQNESGLQVAQPAGAVQPILTADMATKTGTRTDKVGNVVPVWTDAATDLKYSVDGGKTWHAAPATGVPSDLKPFAAPIASLSDGSVVWQFSQHSDDPTGASLYAWKLGDTAWRLLTPAVPTGFIETLTVVSSAGRGDQLWAVTRVITTTSGPIPPTPAPTPFTSTATQTNGTGETQAPSYGTTFRIDAFQL